MKLSLISREYLSSEFNVLTNRPKISDLIKRDLFQLNLSQNDQTIGKRCCRADFTGVSDPFTRSLPNCPLKTDFSGV